MIQRIHVSWFYGVILELDFYTFIPGPDDSGGRAGSLRPARRVRPAGGRRAVPGPLQARPGPRHRQLSDQRQSLQEHRPGGE